MGDARMMAITLKRDGYDISTRNAAIMALQEDFGLPEEEAVNLADEVIAAGRNC